MIQIVLLRILGGLVADTAVDFYMPALAASVIIARA